MKKLFLLFAVFVIYIQHSQCQYLDKNDLLKKIIETKLIFDQFYKTSYYDERTESNSSWADNRFIHIGEDGTFIETSTISKLWRYTIVFSLNDVQISYTKNTDGRSTHYDLKINCTSGDCIQKIYYSKTMNIENNTKVSLLKEYKIYCGEYTVTQKIIDNINTIKRNIPK